jgi:hypothetical protein
VNAIVFVNGQVSRNIDVSEFVYSVLPPTYKSDAIKDLALKTVGTVTGVVQIYIPQLGVLL